MRTREFSQGISFVHKLDPRAKIVTTLSYSLVTATCETVNAASAALVFPLILTAVAGISFRRLFVRLRLVNMFVLFLWFFRPFTFLGSGEILYALGPVKLYRDGVLYCLLITLKSNAIVLTVISLLGTSSILTLVHALSHMGVPDKLVHLFFFCFRYLHVIHSEYDRLTKPMKIRGFRPGTNIHTYRPYAYLVGMLLVRSLDRAERIVAAMKCRGFKGTFYILHHYEMKRQDYLITISSAFFVTLLLVSR